MKYIRKFNDNSEYEQFIVGGDYVIPNICYIEESERLVVKPEVIDMLPSFININNLSSLEIEQLGAKLYKKYGNGSKIITDETFSVTKGAWVIDETNKIDIEYGQNFNTTNCDSVTIIYFYQDTNSSTSPIWYSCANKVIGQGKLNGIDFGGGSN